MRFALVYLTIDKNVQSAGYTVLGWKQTGGRAALAQIKNFSAVSLQQCLYSSYNAEAYRNTTRNRRAVLSVTGRQNPMQVELDRQDVHLLKEIAELGDVSSKLFDQDHRLERLELEGYLCSVRQDPPRSDAGPAWVYRLTLKGVRTGIKRLHFHRFCSWPETSAGTRYPRYKSF